MKFLRVADTCNSYMFSEFLASRPNISENIFTMKCEKLFPPDGREKTCFEAIMGADYSQIKGLKINRAFSNMHKSETGAEIYGTITPSDNYPIEFPVYFCVEGVFSHAESKYGVNIELAADLGVDTLKSLSSVTTPLLKIYDQFRALFSTFESKVDAVKKGKFSIVCQNSKGLYLKSFETPRNKSIFEFERFYNEDTIEFKDNILDKLLKYDKNGIVLLHGEPGTGKTTFIRYLIANSDKSIVYLPPDLTAQIGSPAFITFLIEHAQDSIFIVEDAENILMTREAGANGAVSNLLNLSDGILGDALRIKLVCTINTKFNDIDVALRRKSRLLGEHSFKALNVKKANALLDYLYGEGAVKKYVKDTTVAEIFAAAENTPIIVDKSKLSMGFIAAPQDPDDLDD